MSIRSFCNKNSISMVAVLVSSILLGIVLYTLYYANFTSYLSDDAEACNNCHVMNKHYMTWQASSHKQFVNCNGCHLPQDNMVEKYLAKAESGFNHAFKFTFANYPENILLHPESYHIINNNCSSCHDNLTEMMHWSVTSDEPINCIRCHQNVGHKVSGK